MLGLSRNNFFGEEMDLSEYLKSKKLTRFSVAKQLGISATHMSDICNKKLNPSLELVHRIENFTNGKVTFKDLFIPNARTRLRKKN